MIFRINLEEPMASYLQNLPDLRYVEAMHRKYIEIGPRHKDEGEDVENRTADTLRSGHVNALRAAVVALYFGGRKQEAQRYLDYLITHYPNPNTGQPDELYLKGLYGFVRTESAEMMTGREVLLVIYSLLDRAYIYLAEGQRSGYEESVREAAGVYEKYQKDHRDSETGRQSLKPFTQVQADILISVMTDQSIPAVYRSMIWRGVTDNIRRYSYDVASPVLERDCAAYDLDCTRAFPEPEGMEQFRKDHPDLLMEEDIFRKPEVETIR
jgi:hypothetical protein